MRAHRRRAMPREGKVAVGELAEVLAARREEIEAAIAARVRAVADPGEVSDPTYRDGLRAAISAAVEYAFASLIAGEAHPPPVPVTLLAQARLAARSEVGIDVVLRRYLAGYALVGDVLVAEAARLGMSGEALKRPLRAHAAALDRLLAAVAEEHTREARPSPASAERRRLDLVRRLLAGQPAETAELRYPIEANHLGLACLGSASAVTVREIAAATNRSLLAVSPEPGLVWAWLGGAEPPDWAELRRLAAEAAPPGTAIALGEPAEGLSGWRFTHRQAISALSVTLRGEERVARYADVALLAAALQDDLLATSLRQLYLEPLERERDGGEIAKSTLRAYFAADRNASSTAAVLAVNRNTVAKRLRAIEATIGRTLSSCAPEARGRPAPRGSRWLDRRLIPRSSTLPI